MRPSTFGSAMRCVSGRAEDWPKATPSRKRTIAHSARRFFILSSVALLGAVHADLGALSAMVRRGFEKFLQIWHKQTRARVGRRGDAPNPIVMIGIHLSPDIDETLAETKCKQTCDQKNHLGAALSAKGSYSHRFYTHSGTA